jgi:hypothetical protein
LPIHRWRKVTYSTTATTSMRAHLSPHVEASRSSTGSSKRHKRNYKNRGVYCFVHW